MLLPRVWSQSNIIIFLSYFDNGFPWSFAISFGETIPTLFIFASRINKVKSTFLLCKYFLIVTFGCEVPGDSFYGTCGRWSAATGGGISISRTWHQEAVQVLRVSCLPDHSLHFHEVKPGLTQLLQCFVRCLEQNKVNLEFWSKSPKANLKLEKITACPSCFLILKHWLLH